MRIPTIEGIIERRILINYRVDPEVIKNILPKPFRPKIINNMAMVGICLIRLKDIRPKGLPSFIGISSENGAHRIAMEWDEINQTKEGVYIPRRDSSSKLNVLLGGSIFPGVHNYAKFSVNENQGEYIIEFNSQDGTHLSISASESNEWDHNSIFNDLHSASEFFQNGTKGYSPNYSGLSYEALELTTFDWKATPLLVKNVRSTFFENTNAFPLGSIEFDNALLMRNIKHEWNAIKKI